MPEEKACKLFVCADGKKCSKRGSKKVVRRLREVVAEHGDAVTLKETGCLKLCKTGPSLVVMPGNTSYGDVTAKNCGEIVTAHLNGESIPELQVTRKKKKK